MNLRLEELPTFSEVSSSGIEQAITEIAEQLASLNLEFNTRPESRAIEQLETTISELNERVNIIALQLQHSPTLLEIEPDEEEETLAQTQLQETVSPVESLPTLSPTTEIELSKDEQVIAQINNQLEALNQQFSNQPETQTIKELETEFAQFKEQLTTISLRLGNLPTSPELDMSKLEEEMIDINTQLNALNEQFNARPEIQALEQLGQAMSEMTEQLYAMILHPDGSFSPLEEDAVKDIDFQLNAMELCMDNLPTPPDVNLKGIDGAIADINHHLDSLTIPNSGDKEVLFEVDLRGRNEAISDINRELDALNQRLNSRLDKRAIEQLEAGMTKLKNEINAVVFHLENLPTPSEMDFHAEEPNIADLQW